MERTVVNYIDRDGTAQKVTWLPPLNERQVETLRRLLQSWGAAPAVSNDIFGRALEYCYPRPATKARYVMTNAVKLEEVVTAIWRHPSRYKRVAVTLLLRMMALVQSSFGTAVVPATRRELADQLGVKPDRITDIVSVLREVGAVTTERHKTGVMYILDPELAMAGRPEQREAAVVDFASRRRRARAEQARQLALGLDREQGRGGDGPQPLARVLARQAQKLVDALPREP